MRRSSAVSPGGTRDPPRWRAETLACLAATEGAGALIHDAGFVLGPAVTVVPPGERASLEAPRSSTRWCSSRPAALRAVQVLKEGGPLGPLRESEARAVTFLIGAPAAAELDELGARCASGSK